MVTLSIIIPTLGGGRPLKRTLNSVASQPLLEGDEVLVIHDSQKISLPGQGPDPVEALVDDFGYDYRRHWCAEHGHLEGHCYGHCQINAGMAEARGDYLVYQDDDDVFVEGAFDAIRRAASLSPGRPLMFRFVTRFRTLLWATREIREDWVGGHSFVVPNVKARLAPWAPRYQGDFDHIRGTVDLWPGKDEAVVWREEVVSFARPETPG